jgi:amino acid adenylation domain-containing protein/non-ribosomal peptide synthase protein (TIGR01720 family)
MTGQVYVFPASYAQRGLWFLDQLTPGSSLYNIQVGIRISSAVNVPRLEWSINEIVRRHESLRTTFKAVDGEPVQLVHPEVHIQLRLTDLSELTEPQREEAALLIATEEADMPFDLATWPLLRTRLLHLDAEDHIVLVTLHHIICDFWSLEVFQNELSTLYEASSADGPSPLAELPIQYADFAEWQRRWLQRPAGQSQLDYWKKQLADLPALELWTDWPKPEGSSFDGAAYDFDLQSSLHAALVRLSQEEKVTLFMTMLAAFEVLLQRYTGQDDIVVGTPFANRDRIELENLIGFFVNSLVLRVDLSGDPTFREVLSRVRRIVLEAYEHQDVPFEKLVSQLRPERELAHNPLFRVHFQLFSIMGSDQGAGTLAGEPFGTETSTAKFDLALDIWEYADVLWGHLEYSTDLFAEPTIERLAGHFWALLEAITSDPDRRLSELPFLTDDECHQMLVDWNQTNVYDPRGVSLEQLFEAQVQRAPGAIALTFRQEQLTYSELNRRANQLAHYLRSMGVGPESLVGICVERSLEMVIGLLGILKAGGAYLPLDPSDPAARLLFILEDAKPQILLMQQRLAEAIPAISQQPRVFLDADWHKIAGYGEANPAVKVDPQNLAYVIYTSGSTGEPKGVLISSQAVCNHLLWMQTAFPLKSTDAVPQKYPFNFDASICEIFGPLIAGARLIIIQPSDHWDVSEFILFLQDQNITAIDVVPNMLEALLGETEFSSCHSLRRVISGGDALTAELRDRFFAQMDTELHNLYGPTETTISATSWTCLPEQTEPCVPIGRPGANTQVYILDRHLNPVPIGVQGELVIGGEGLARGYLNHPGLTAEKFIPNPFSDTPDARMYKTGDLARFLPDGTIEYVGRKDDQVKLGGRRIELGEIESVLARHESVRSCAVTAIEDDYGHKKLVAHVVPVREQPELWPSLGEYDVYDELLYYAMTHDEPRNRAYRAAIDRAVEGSVVLDIGTGADAVLARFCIGAGAEKVYAIEVGEDAFRRAREQVERLGLTNRITLIHGDSTQVRLPEKVDVCVSEIIGTIGSSEGAISILNDARRFLKDEGTMIPRRCITRIAPVSLPDQLANSLHLNKLPAAYVRQVFDKVGHPFDLRICIKNFSEANLLSPPSIFEDLDFSGLVTPELEADVRFSVSRASILHGFLLWLNLYPADGELLDSLNDSLSWLPVFFPVFYPGINVSAGDVIRARCARRTGEYGSMPDYAIKGVLTRRQGQPVTFSYTAPRCTAAFKESPFYESLFAGLDGQLRPLVAEQDPPRTADANRGEAYALEEPEEPARALVPMLRRFLHDRLPKYMIPSSFVVVDALPETSSGKLDRRALRVTLQGRSGLEEAYVAPRDRAEEALAQIWSELLGVGRVGIHDNFFELGGDSILSIQIIARANRAGLRLRPAQLFQHQTIAELAAVAGSASFIEPDQGVLTGAVTLIPVQRWFFEQNFTHPHHYNQSMLIELPPSVDTAGLTTALEYLTVHHDALRLRYARAESGWQQALAGARDRLTMTRIDLSTMQKAEQEAALQSTASELQASLDLSSGPLLRAAVIDLGSRHGLYLLLVIHHLVVDSVSWRILMEDLWTAYEQLTGLQEIQLPPKTTSFQAWAQLLAEYAQSAELEQEQAHWLALSDALVASLPVDRTGGVNSAASARTVSATLDAEETRALLEDIPKAFHSQINDVLLTALVQALARWTGRDAFLIDLEGHGREDIIEGVDLTRTVGWFTTIFPVCLRLHSATTPAEALRSIKEQLRGVPRRGIGYGLLRYLNRDAEVRERLRALPQAEITFNYLGQFGRSQAESASWKHLTGLTGPNLNPQGHRPGLLEIDGSVADGHLEVILTYSENVHLHSTIETFAAYFVAALRALIKEASAPDVHGFTPSDFSKARLTQRELDKLISKLH